MGKAGIAFLLPVIFLSCINHQDEDDKEVKYWENNYEVYNVEFADGFHMETYEDGTLLKTYNIEGMRNGKINFGYRSTKAIRNQIIKLFIFQ